MNKSKNRVFIQLQLSGHQPFSSTYLLTLLLMEFWAGQSTGDSNARHKFCTFNLAPYLAIGTGFGISSIILYTDIKIKNMKMLMWANKFSLSRRFFSRAYTSIAFIFINPYFIFSEPDAVLTYAKSYTKVTACGGFFKL